MTTRHLLEALSLLMLAACAGASTTGSSPKAPAGSGGPTGTLLALESRDHVCWVRVLTNTGDGSFEGDLVLCPGAPKDASGLIGQAIMTTTRVKVPASACDGGVACAKRDVIIDIFRKP